MAILVENIFTNGNKIIDSKKLVSSIRGLNLYLNSIGEKGNKPGFLDIKDKLKSSDINGNILFFKSVEDSIRLRKTQIKHKDIGYIKRSVKFGGRYKRGVNMKYKTTRRRCR
jgi:hypothetical protein